MLMIIAASKAADSEDVINALCDNRMYFLKGLSTWGTFGRGWTNRVNDVRRDALADAGAAPRPVDESDSETQPPPKTIDEALARIDMPVADIRRLANVATQPAPQMNWGKLLQPLLAELAPKLLPMLMPLIVKMLPDLLPYLMEAMFKPRQQFVSNPNAKFAAAGGIGGLLGAIATHYVTKGAP